jgi:alcohol dehydrogenase (NADP+)
VNAFTLIANGIKLGGSAIGAPGEIEEMLKLAADQKVKPWIQERPLNDANQVVVDLEAGKARYRYVLVNEKHAKKWVFSLGDTDSLLFDLDVTGQKWTDEQMIDE